MEKIGNKEFNVYDDGSASLVVRSEYRIDHINIEADEIRPLLLALAKHCGAEVIDNGMVLCSTEDDYDLEGSTVIILPAKGGVECYKY